MEKTPNYLDEDVRKELECPVCLEYMKPPISMCENGHSICSTCKPKLNKCPSCRRPFLPVRNLALESLSTMLANKNTDPKSSETTAKLYKCPFSTISKEDCGWVGSVHDMKSHIKNGHNNQNDTHKSNGRFNVVLTDLSPERHYRKAVWSGEDLLFYVVWEIKGGNFYCAVLYIGQKKKSAKFTYKFSLTTDNGMKNISMVFRTQNVVTSMEKFFAPGDCVLLHYDTVLKFLNSEKSLHCAFEISSIESASVRDVNQPKHAARSDINSDKECPTNERDLLEQEVKRKLMASYENLSHDFDPHHSDTYRGGKAGRRGRGGSRGRFSRAARRGAADRHLEPQVYHQSGYRDYQNKGKLHARNLNLGRSLTDLRDPALYDDEPWGSEIAHPDRNKFNSSCSSSALKDEKIYQLASVPGKSSLTTDKLSPVKKPPDSLQERVPTAISVPSLSSLKYASSEQVFTHEIAKGNSETNAPKVKLPSSERVTDVSLLGKITGSSGNLTTVPTISQTHSKAARVYSTLDSITRDDYQYTNHPLSKTASEDTWKCSLCGYFVPVEVKKNYYRLMDIRPPGTSWKCPVCEQWRPCK
jgi:hypothetical protein